MLEKFVFLKMILKVEGSFPRYSEGKKNEPMILTPSRVFRLIVLSPKRGLESEKECKGIRKTMTKTLETNTLHFHFLFIIITMPLLQNHQKQK